MFHVGTYKHCVGGENCKFRRQRESVRVYLCENAWAATATAPKLKWQPQEIENDCECVSLMGCPNPGLRLKKEKLKTGQESR